MDKRGELQSTLRIEDVPTVRSMVAQKLREAIMSGTFKPGQRLVGQAADTAYHRRLHQRCPVSDLRCGAQIIHGVG